ncbi:MAG: class I SAM-dependent methyltransferase [Rhodocyclales bacterium]|nr:class I SAM-dependent methyltransferase [Rhodocyclales bacterium]
MNDAAPDPDAHWRTLAGGWNLLGSPLRPCAEDVCAFGEMLTAETDLFRTAERKRVWLLGITPEIAAASWLQDLDLLAVEHARAMIEAVWAGDTDRRQAICANWLHAPFADESFDLVIGDGCLTVVDFPDGLSRLLASVHRCLRQDGSLMLRLFCRPDVAETPDAVIAALHSGAIGNFHAFKWRLAMAVQGIADAPDVAVDAVWQAWNEARIDARELAEVRGWRLAQVGTIEFYRGSSARYSFMRFDEAIRHLQRAGFDLVATRTGSYELAERCPRVLLRKRQGASGAHAP